MKQSGTPIKNLFLVLASVAFVFIATIGADRALGVITRPPDLPEAIELIFPPFAEQHFKTVDFEYTVHTNALGLRERELPRERGDAYRILAIGDSYTYGWGVALEEAWPRLVENQLRDAGYNVEVLNLGKPGAGPPFYAELAEQAIPLLRPDLVIVAMLQGNDLRDAGPETTGPAASTFWDKARALYPNLARFMRDLRRERAFAGRTHEDFPPQTTTAEDNRRWTANTAQNFVEAMTPEQQTRFNALEDPVKEAFLGGMLNPYMIDLAMQDPDAYTKAIDPEDPWTQVCIARAAARFARIKDMAEQYDCRVVVASVPEGPYVNRVALENMARVGYVMPAWLLETDGMDEGIRMACELASVPFYEVTEQFRAHKNDPDLYFELDGHPTPKGNSLFSEAFTPILKDIISAHAKPSP